jgi:UDP-N-acetylmuramate--alanine ligase
MKHYKYIYVLGIGGMGMSALARWFHRKGAQVFGHDKVHTPFTHQLIQEGIPIHYEATVDAIPIDILEHPQDTLVLYTPSIAITHSIWQYLSTHGYNLCKRGDILDSITETHFTLAIAGTHGKTTSTSLAAHILCYANRNITAFLGGIAKNYNSNFIASSNTEQKASVVIEADEFDRFFLKLHPDIAIVTTIDPDHLDVYKDQDGFEEGFKQFLSRLPKQGIAILHSEVAKRLIGHELYLPQVQVMQYALENSSIYAGNIYIEETGKFCFDYISKNIVIKDIQLPVPGYHNIENALAVITACLHIGIAPSIIRDAIHTFQGVARRFDPIIQRNGLVFIDDYGHHPVEITVLLTTIRKLYPNKKVTVIFRPNQYSRTKDFLQEIAQSLSLADCVFVLDIYSDREAPIEGIDSEAILQHITLPHKYACTKENLVLQLAQMDKLEVVVNVGAGDADEFIQPIKEFLLNNYC